MNKRLGHYEIVSELGRGGMGVVYKAYEPALDRHVALKVLSNQMADDPVVVARFQREARSVAALNHPNIIQIFFIGESDGQHYFVMEFVEGESLSAFIRKEKRIAVPRALEIMIQVAEGLAAAHDIGVVHRDIKPANIMLDRRGRVKIADFGIALTADLQKKLTSTGQFLGTPGYLSPEVCLGEKADARTDIFSLGIVFYEMLSGEVPFHADSPLAMLSKVVNEAVPDVRHINTSVEPEVQAILSIMVEKKRENRFSNCHDLLIALKEQFGKIQTVRVTQQSMMTAPTEAIAVLRDTAPPPPPAFTEDLGPKAPPLPPSIPPMAEAAVVPPPPGTEPMARQHEAGIRKPIHQPGKKHGWLLPVFLLLLIPVLIGGGYFWWQENQKGNTNTQIAENQHGASEELVPEDKAPDGEIDNAAGPIPTSEGDTADTQNGEDSAESLAESVTFEEPADTEPANPEQIVLPNGGGAGTPGEKPADQQASINDVKSHSGHSDSRPVNKVTDAVETTATPTMTPEQGKSQKTATLMGRAQMVVLVSGDTWVAEPASIELQGLFRGEEYDIVDGAMFEGLEGLAEEKRVNVKNLSKTVGRQGGHILVLAQIIYLGERELKYMGRSSTAYRSRFKVSAIALENQRKIVPDWQTEFEYTQLNASSKVEDACRQIPESWLKAVREVAQKL